MKNIEMPDLFTKSEGLEPATLCSREVTFFSIKVFQMSEIMA